MNQNKPLTAEEAKNLTFPCLLEVWEFSRSGPGIYVVVDRLTEDGKFRANSNWIWQNAALPPPEIEEAMRKQFGSKNEYPKRMLVWDDDKSNSRERIVLADLGEKALYGRYITVFSADESKFENGDFFHWNHYEHAESIDLAQKRKEEKQKLLAEALRLETIAKTIREQAENL